MIKIIDEQPDFLVVEKPAGVNFHDTHSHQAANIQRSSEKPTAKIEILETQPKHERTPAAQGVFNQLKDQTGLDLFPVHRLDTLTSGLLICAKNKTAAAKFGALFEKHEMEKYYVAISDSKPKKKQGMIKGDMEKARSGNWKLTTSTSNPAITQFFSCSLSPGYRLYLLKPLTGRTHQIRVALKSIGAPIIGDPRYHSAKSVENSDRGYLHAYALAFEWDGSTYSYRLPPTEGNLFTHENCIAQLNDGYKEPWTLTWPKI